MVHKGVTEPSNWLLRQWDFEPPSQPQTPTFDFSPCNQLLPCNQRTTEARTATKYSTDSRFRVSCWIHTRARAHTHTPGEGDQGAEPRSAPSMKTKDADTQTPPHTHTHVITPRTENHVHIVSVHHQIVQGSVGRAEPMMHTNAHTHIYRHAFFCHCFWVRL